MTTDSITSLAELLRKAEAELAKAEALLRQAEADLLPGPCLHAIRAFLRARS